MNKEIIIKITIYIIITLLIGYYLGNVQTVRAEDKVQTLDNEITILSKEYKVNEILVRNIIDCEGKIYGYKDNKNISTTTGKVWSTDHGPMQINDYWHESTMKKLGLDINNRYDSLKYGIMLLAQEGTKPWNASKWCWNK